MTKRLEKRTPEEKSKQSVKKLSRTRKVLAWVILVPLFLMLILAIIGAIVGGNKTTNTSGKQTAQQIQSQTTATAQQPQIGQTVSDAGFNFVVNSIKCGETQLRTSGLVYYYSDAQGQYCRLNITVTNTGNTANSIGVSQQYVFNSQGQRYEYASDATATAANAYAGSPLNGEINPGNSITGDIVYDVPVGVTPTMAELHGDYDSLGVRVNLQ